MHALLHTFEISNWQLSVWITRVIWSMQKDSSVGSSHTKLFPFIFLFISRNVEHTLDIFSVHNIQVFNWYTRKLENNIENEITAEIVNISTRYMCVYMYAGSQYLEREKEEKSKNKTTAKVLFECRMHSALSI